MNKIPRFMLVFLLLPIFISAQEQEKILFQDDFKNYQNGSSGAPFWYVTKGFWKVEDGKFIQASEEYDCGAMLNFYLETSFELSFKFRVMSGTPGVGIFFNSKQRENTSFSHMCRFESESTFLIGKFIYGEYDCTHNVMLKKQNLSKWRKLRLVVDAANKVFSIFLEDTPVVENEAYLYGPGYCGLQSSGGEIAFDDVELKLFSAQKNLANLAWIDRFVLTGRDKILFPHLALKKVMEIDRRGKVLRCIGAPASERGQFKAPVSIARFRDGCFAVSDSAERRIQFFNKKGKWKQLLGGNDKFAVPGDLAVDADGNLYVIDQGRRAIVVFNRKMQKIAEFGKSTLENPAAIDVRMDSIFVVNNGPHRVEIFKNNGGKISKIDGFSFHAGLAKDILVAQKKIYVSVDKEIRVFDREGNFIKTFKAELLKEFHPSGLAMNDKNQLLVSDPMQGKIYIFDENLSETKPEVDFRSSTNAEISFSTSIPQKAGIRVFGQDSVLFQKTDDEKRYHQFVLQNLPHSTVYHFSISPVYEQIPPAKPWSRHFVFITPAETGKKAVWRIPMATIIFANVLDTAKWKNTFPPLPELPESEINRIKAQINDGIKFYWMNSGMNLWLDNKFIVVKNQYFRHQLFGDEWWYPPHEEMVQKAIRDAGYDTDQFKSVLYLVCVRDYDEKDGSYHLRGRGGGFTSGLSANGKYGISYWEVTHANHFSGNNWLMVHEFHHQLDELFLLSGYPEYWFNHFSPTIGMAAHFGEHFDGNAWILKNWQTDKWFDLKFGDMIFTDDQDADGIPDDDLRFPVDEKRLGSSPLFADYDKDGVIDGAEIDFSNWVVEGCGETYGGAAIFPSILKSDADGDFISDGEDPYPLYPFKPIIFSGDSAINAQNLNQELFFARLVDSRIHAEVFASWDSTALTFAFVTDRAAPIKLMLDCDADGWFLGRDNLRFYLNPVSDSTLDTKIEVVNCSVPRRWPFHDEKLADEVKFSAKINTEEDDNLFLLKIYKNDRLGLKLKNREKIGINIGFKVVMDEAGHQRFVTIFEPNRFFDVSLEQKKKN